MLPSDVRIFHIPKMLILVTITIIMQTLYSVYSVTLTQVSLTPTTGTVTVIIITFII